MTGLILAGGLSARFGHDKALASCPGDTDTRPCLLRMVAQLDSLPCIERVTVSCRREQKNAFRMILPPHVSLIFDESMEKDAGERTILGPTPLHGLRAALESLGGPLLTLPCDMPHMKASMLMELVRARDAAVRQDSALLRTAFIHPDGVIEGLIAIYEAGCLPYVKTALSSGKIGLYSLIPAERQMLVESTDDAAFWNMNTAESVKESLSKPRKPWCTQS